MSKYEYGNGQVIDELTGWDPLLGLHSIPPKAGIQVPQDAEGALGAVRTPHLGKKKALQNTSGGGTIATEGLRFLTAKELAEMTPEEPEWIWSPYVTRGNITLINGKIKAAGKTTMVTHACSSILDGRPFLGYPTKKTGVMYLTEQTKESSREFLRRAKLLDRDDFFLLHWHNTKGVSWANVVDLAVEESKRRGLGLFVVDTLSRFAGLTGDRENNAGDALKAMEPLKYAAGEGLGVVVIGHERKSGGDIGDSGRGSSAFGGEADIIVSIKRPEGNARPTMREIHALGRFDQTPEKLVVDLTDKGYKALGSDAAVAEEEAREAILGALPGTENEAMTLDELLEEVKKDGVKRTTAQTALSELIGAHFVIRTGKGVKKDAFRYWKSDSALGNSSEFLQDTSMNTTADPTVSTVFGEGGNSSDEKDGGTTEEYVQGMLATSELEDYIRYPKVLRAVREYLGHPYKSFEGMEEMMEDLSHGRYLWEPIGFEPRMEEVKRAFDEYNQEMDKISSPQIS